MHTTPIAVPISVTMGEPDISLRMLSAAWVIHNRPSKWRIVQENHRRPSTTAGPVLTGFWRALKEGVHVIASRPFVLQMSRFA